MRISGIFFIIFGLIVCFAVASSADAKAIELVKALAFASVGFIAGIGTNKDD